MRKPKTRIEKAIRLWYGTRLAVVLESVLIGFMVGFAIVLFRVLLGRANTLRAWLYGTFLPGKPWYWIAGLILTLCLIGIFLGWTVKVRPMIRGSGIPQVKGDLIRELSLDWGRNCP